MKRQVSMFVSSALKYSLAYMFAIFLVTTSGCVISYSNPPLSLGKSDLIGTWEAKYFENSIDRILLQEDSFQQVYQAEGSDFAVAGNEWRLERLPNGSVRIYLPAAQYYASGAENADLLPTYDPFTNETLTVVDELVLQVLVDSAGNLVLHHLFVDPDEGIPLFGEDKALFRRVVTP